MARLYTQEEANAKVLAVLESTGFILVSDFEYKGSNKTKITVQCNKKHEPYNVLFNNLVNCKTGCPTCAKGCISRHLFRTRTMKR